MIFHHPPSRDQVKLHFLFHLLYNVSQQNRFPCRLPHQQDLPWILSPFHLLIKYNPRFLSSPLPVNASFHPSPLLKQHP